MDTRTYSYDAGGCETKNHDVAGSQPNHTLHSSGVQNTDFRAACARFPTGVTVLAVLGEDGAPHGITISSFASLSLCPPLILVCVDHRSRILEYLEADGAFGLCVLGEHQQHLSVQFSKAWCERFINVDWYPGSTGVPLLHDVSALFECSTNKMIAVGDHTIVIGEVLRVASSDRCPLVYVNSSYRGLVSAESCPEFATKL